MPLVPGLKANSALAILVAFSEVACASTGRLAKMDPSRAIDTEHGYRQDNAALDREDMLRKLEHEPVAAPAVGRARALATISLLLAGVGGALIGWPLGEKLAGNEQPHWSLLYAGGATVAVAIPLAFWADGSVSSAVRAHNEGIEASRPSAR